MLYLALERMSLSLYVMVALRRDVAQSSEAAMKYNVLGALATGFLLYGISMLYGVTGSLELNQVLKAVASGCINNAVLLFGVVFIVAGAAFKMGAVPFHMWVSDVYQGSPTAMTLFVGSGPKVAPFARGLRFVLMDLLPYSRDRGRDPDRGLLDGPVHHAVIAQSEEKPHGVRFDVEPSDARNPPRCGHCAPADRAALHRLGVPREVRQAHASRARAEQAFDVLRLWRPARRGAPGIKVYGEVQASCVIINTTRYPSETEIHAASSSHHPVMINSRRLGTACRNFLPTIRTGPIYRALVRRLI
ncbi:Proton-conducting membrane transporter [Burkholderia sp. GAS332]|nr:Proton-conducting membrane transporter [Burkholderia sp. GAS332]